MPTIQKAKNTSRGSRNGAVQSHQQAPVPLPGYSPPIGRAARKPVDQVRRGFLRAMRSLKEIQSSWELFNPLSADGTAYELRADAGPYVAKSVGLLMEGLAVTRGEIDRLTDDAVKMGKG